MWVEQFVRLIGNAEHHWGRVSIFGEFFYARGRTDVIALANDATLIAFEAKLKDWRSALDQAYRNTCFAHKSFVVVPRAIALIAFAYVAEFKKRGVGLCYVDDAGLTVLEESEFSTPIEPWIATQAVTRMLSDRKES
jgi:hypothetical protein